MDDLATRAGALVTLCATLAACASGSDPQGGGLATFDGGMDDASESGDEDGDPTTSGDGDGDPTTTGDGDGDPTTIGDGDGDGDIVPVDMFDNFEDGNGALIPSGGRQGYWYTYNDENVGASQTPA